jgi:hypothetical protein
MGATGRVVLEEAGGRTRLTVRIECSSAAHLEHYLKMGIDAGTAKTLDNLVAYIRARPRAELQRAGQACIKSET